MTNSIENKILFINIKFKQKSGFVGFVALKKSEDFTNSFSFVASAPNTFVQLTNHTKILSTKTIFGETFENYESNQIDGVLSMNFKVNSSEILDKTYFHFIGNPNERITINNGTITIPKHTITGDERFFSINSPISKLQCSDKIFYPGRFFAVHWSLLLLLSCYYILIFYLFLSFKDQQPFKSRFIAPYFTLFASYFNLMSEAFTDSITHEQFSKIYCPYINFFVYPGVQVK